MHKGFRWISFDETDIVEPAIGAEQIFHATGLTPALDGYAAMMPRS